MALTNNLQQADTGTKMIHIGPKTKSTIVSKGISAGNSKIAIEVLSKWEQKLQDQEITVNVIQC